MDSEKTYSITPPRIVLWFGLGCAVAYALFLWGVSQSPGEPSSEFAHIVMWLLLALSFAIVLFYFGMPHYRIGPQTLKKYQFLLHVRTIPFSDIQNAEVRQPDMLELTDAAENKYLLCMVRRGKSPKAGDTHLAEALLGRLQAAGVKLPPSKDFEYVLAKPLIGGTGSGAKRDFSSERRLDYGPAYMGIVVFGLVLFSALSCFWLMGLIYGEAFSEAASGQVNVVTREGKVLGFLISIIVLAIAIFELIRCLKLKAYWDRLGIEIQAPFKDVRHYSWAQVKHYVFDRRGGLTLYFADGTRFNFPEHMRRFNRLMEALNANAS